MSFVFVEPQTMSAFAADLSGIGSALGAANAAAAASTTDVLAAAADEVSVQIAALFSQNAAGYQQISAQVATSYERFVQAVTAGAGAYAATEAGAAQALSGLLAAPAAPLDIFAGLNAALTANPAGLTLPPLGLTLPPLSLTLPPLTFPSLPGLPNLGANIGANINALVNLGVSLPTLTLPPLNFPPLSFPSLPPVLPLGAAINAAIIAVLPPVTCRCRSRRCTGLPPLTFPSLPGLPDLAANIAATSTWC